MTEPKNCPFCAVELDLIREPDALRRFWRHPDGICCLNGFIVDENEADLAAWNSRAPWTVTRERAEEAYGLMRQAMRRDHLQGKAQHVIEPFIAALGGKVEG